jgi:hypothetical protein
MFPFVKFTKMLSGFPLNFIVSKAPSSVKKCCGILPVYAIMGRLKKKKASANT